MEAVKTGLDMKEKVEVDNNNHAGDPVETGLADRTAGSYVPYGDLPALAKEVKVVVGEERWRLCYVPYKEENREKEKMGELEERMERMEESERRR